MDVSKCTELKQFICHSNLLTELDVSQNTALTEFSCGGNQLTSLDVSNNTALTSLSCYGNEYMISVSADGTFDLSTLPGNFDVNKTSDWVGGTISGHILMIGGDTNKITYSYDCGNGKSETFTLWNVSLIPETLQINETYFPDANFREVVSRFDTNKDGILSKDEIIKVTEIGYFSKNICDLKGIEYFIKLETLDCDANELVGLDLSNNTELVSLSCNSNQLTKLDLSKNTKLERLYCCNNKLQMLDVSDCTALTTIQCDRNQLTALEVSKNAKLKGIFCEYNQLTALDVSKNTKLEWLWCDHNQLAVLDVSSNTALKELACYNNQLTALEVSSNTELTNLSCYNNQLTALDVSSNTELTNLSCYSNRLTALDVSKNTALTDLWCSNNKLTNLDVRNCTALTSIRCDGNQLTSLDVSNCAALALESFSCVSNKYLLTSVGEREYDLSTLPGNFDVNKASDWVGGSVKENILKVDKGVFEVTYKYDCGKNNSGKFTLLLLQPSGDVNGDGILDAKDLLYMRRYVADIEVGIKMDMTAADMDGDGIITPADCLLLRKTLAGVIDVKAIDKRV